MAIIISDPFIFQLIRRQKRVLVCAPTHKAIDHIQVCCHGLGLHHHWTRLNGPSNGFTRTLDYLREAHPKATDLKKLYAEINALNAQINGIKKKRLYCLKLFEKIL